MKRASYILQANTVVGVGLAWVAMCPPPPPQEKLYETLLDLTGQTGSYATAKSDRSDWQSCDHKVGQVRLAVTRPLNLTGHTGSHMTTKSDRSDWQSHDHKVRQVVTQPLNLTGQTGSHATTKSDRSDWQSRDR